MPKVYIVIHSLWGHVVKLAEEVKKGLETSGCEAKIFQVAETLPQEVLTKMYAAKFEYPVITADQLTEADGLIFGFGTRYGVMSAQMKAFFDTTGGLWAKGALVNKFAACFGSSATQHGGHETNLYTLLTHFAHHGMVYVPLGYTHPALQDNSEVCGGSPYGAGTIAGGDGSRQPSEKELAIAQHQGKHFGSVLSAYVKGKN